MQEQICANCTKKALYICGRCMYEQYCSKSCQESAFSQHRRECFSIPSLKIIDGNLSSNNSGEVELLDKSSTGLNKIDEPPKTQEPKDSNEPQESNANAKEEVAVDSVDKNVSLNQKKLITPAFNQGVRTVPPNTYKKSPSVISIPKQAEMVVEEVPKSAPEKKVFNMDQMRRNQQNPMMSQTAKTPKEKRYFLKDLKTRKLGRGKYKIKLVNGNDTTKIFYVTEAIDVVDQFISYIEKNISDFVATEKSTNYKPMKQEMVLAKYDGNYYRAVVEDINMNNPEKPLYHIFFVDYGNDLEVTEADMKPFPQKLSNELTLNQVFLRNFPDNVTDKEAQILGDENGININIVDESDNCYIADIIGI